MSDRPATPVRVIVVEDQRLVRRGIVELLEPEHDVEVLGEAEDGVEALREIARLKPDVALVDARMPRMDGVELIRRLTNDHPPRRGDRPDHLRRRRVRVRKAPRRSEGVSAQGHLPGGSGVGHRQGQQG